MRQVHMAFGISCADVASQTSCIVSTNSGKRINALTSLSFSIDFAHPLKFHEYGNFPSTALLILRYWGTKLVSREHM